MNSLALVIGASGQVGHQIALALGESAVPAGRTHREGNWLQIDLAQIAKNPSIATEILDKHDFGAVYCVGGATNVDLCESETEWAMDTNCNGPVALAKACTHIPFVYFSTEYIFDGEAGPYSEDDAAHPLSVYGKSKWQAEQQILETHPSALIVRTTVVYGEDLGGKNFLYTMKRLLSAGMSMRVPIDQFSTPTYNVDLASAATALAKNRESGIFHVAGPELLSRYDFAATAAKILGLNLGLLIAVRTSELNQRAPRPLRAGLITSKLQNRQLTMRANADAIREWHVYLTMGESS